MKKILSLLTIAAVSASTSQAQTVVTDSIEMGPNYINDIFYSLKDGQVSSAVNNNWHLGFQMNSFSVGVIANHNAGSVSVYSLNKSASAHFDHIGAADTVGKTSTPLNNSVHTWDEGAFNMNKDQANAMNNGWGDYDMSSHNIIGDSTYLVNIGTESYKVAILKNVTNPLDSVSWTFRIAKLDGSNDVTKKVYKVAGGFNNRNFAYYNVQTDQFIDREGVSNAQWDMMFGKYVDSTAMGASKVLYNVTGVLLNRNIKAAKIENIDPSTITGYNNEPLSTSINTVGYEWKWFTGGSWVIPEDLSYFVRSGADTTKMYLVQFTAFGGSTNGKVVMNKTLFSTTKINDVTTDLNEVGVMPNPVTNGQIKVMVDAKAKIQNASIKMVDVTGKLVYNHNVSMQQGMNGYNIAVQQLPAGQYFLQIVTPQGAQTQQVVIK